MRVRQGLLDIYKVLPLDEIQPIVTRRFDLLSIRESNLGPLEILVDRTTQLIN